MSERRIQIDKFEQLALENIMLKEEILRRDWTKVNEQKESLTKGLLSKYSIDPEKEVYSIELNGITVKDKSVS